MVHETKDYICSEFADMVNEQVESINNALGKVVVEVENSEELDGGINIYIDGNDCRDRDYKPINFYNS